jgi:hypothetical protein
MPRLPARASFARRKSTLAVAFFAVIAATSLAHACSPFAASTDASDDGGTTTSAALEAGADGHASVDASGAAPDGGAQTDASSSPDASVAFSCPAAKHGASLVAVADGGCVEATEVTLQQYKAMIADLNGMSLSVGFCTGPSDFGALTAGCTPPAVAPDASDEPITCVTQCDAMIYCAWAGKHLCGSRVAGALTWDALDAAADEWTFACTNGGAMNVPATINNCNFGGTLKSVGRCEGPPGVFDLLGNAGEWTASPLGGGGNVHIAGDTYGYQGDSMGSKTCLANDNNSAGARFSDVGFRCCATPSP